MDQQDQGLEPHRLEPPDGFALLLQPNQLLLFELNPLEMFDRYQHCKAKTDDRLNCQDEHLLIFPQRRNRLQKRQQNRCDPQQVQSQRHYRELLVHELGQMRVLKLSARVGLCFDIGEIMLQLCQSKGPIQVLGAFLLIFLFGLVHAQIGLLPELGDWFDVEHSLLK